MQQVVIALSFTSYGVEFTSPMGDVYAPWVSVGAGLIIGGVLVAVRAVKIAKASR